MNKNYKKMENSGHKSMSSVWFNSQLFTLNGTPLKFHVEGYSPIDFHEMVKIIEAYGGELSQPDATDTLIFCESDGPVGGGDHDRYDVQYFRDSIIALQPQNLINYKLQGFTNQQNTSTTNTKESPSPEHENSCRNPSKDDGDSHGSGVFQTAYDSDPSQVESELEDVQSRLPHSVSARRAGKFTRLTCSEEDNAKIIKWLIKKNVMPTHAGPSFWKEFINEKILPHLNLTGAKLVGHFNRNLREHPAFVKHVEDVNASGRVLEPPPKSINPRYTEEEDRLLIEYVIDNNAISFAGSRNFWKHFLEKFKSSMNPLRTYVGISIHYIRVASKNYAKYTTDPEAMRQFKEFNNRTIPHDV